VYRTNINPDTNTGGDAIINTDPTVNHDHCDSHGRVAYTHSHAFPHDDPVTNTIARCKSDADSNPACRGTYTDADYSDRHFHLDRGYAQPETGYSNAECHSDCYPVRYIIQRKRDTRPSARVSTDRGSSVMATPQETRVTNELTGGQKGAKDSQLSAAPAGAMLALGRVYGFGAEKYDRHNFRKGYAWSLSYDAMQRHIEASLAGEDYDPESGLPHMAHVAWHALTLTQFLLDKLAGRHPAELDDRYAYDQ